MTTQHWNLSILITPADGLMGPWLARCLELEATATGATLDEAIDATLEPIREAFTEALAQGREPPWRQADPALLREAEGLQRRGARWDLDEVGQDRPSDQQIRAALADYVRVSLSPSPSAGSLAPSLSIKKHVNVLARFDDQHERLQDILNGGQVPQFLELARSLDVTSLRRFGFYRCRDALRGVDLRGFDLDGVSLASSVLTDADLRGCSMRRIRMHSCTLNRTRLDGADLREARIDEHYDMQQGTSFWKASLVGARLDRATLPTVFLGDCDLRRASLQGANLAAVNLRGSTLREARLRGARLDMEWIPDGQSSEDEQPASLERADLRDADLREVNLRGADLSSADLRGADLRGAVLLGTCLEGASLSGTLLAGCAWNPGTRWPGEPPADGFYLAPGAALTPALFHRLLQAQALQGLEIIGLSLSGANLAGINLRGARLRDVDLSGADLRGVDLRDAILEGVDLRGADLRRMKKERDTRFVRCQHDQRTQWPNGFEPRQEG